MMDLFPFLKAQSLLPSFPSDLAALASYALSIKVLLWQIGTYIPRAVNDYGFAYFGFKKPYYPKLSFKIALLFLAVIFIHWSQSTYQLTITTLPFLTLVISALIGVFILDIKFKVIPDRFHLVGIAGAVGIIAIQFLKSPLSAKILLTNHLQALSLPIILFISSYVYEKIRKKVGMGMGDIKLFFWLSLIFGSQLYLIFFITLMLAILIKIPQCLLNPKSAFSPFAFAPHIIGACLIWSFIRPYLFI